MIGKILEFVGVFVVALVAGVSGGVGAVTALHQNPDASCGANPFCTLGRAVKWPVIATGPTCQTGADARLIAIFTATLLDNRPLDAQETKVADAIAAAAGGGCASVESVLVAACRAVEGGNTRSTEACAAIKSSAK